ncbi:hypothetical protein FAIPA1_310049 [Frankia sp. AiPs1]|uniref:hypothetical protein n=1 Tax=Frankia sp. AiPa1 TaxID=573492 RepID=UPI00202B1F1E|nr:hypothetical protein [Frankia sp. AiPa1]MCL9759211.1 hypothetical protein [Frankia sp. AiPa1]
MRIPDNGVGDLARALRALQPVDDAQAALAARVLGLTADPAGGLPPQAVFSSTLPAPWTEPDDDDAAPSRAAGGAPVAGGPVSVPTRQSHRRGPPADRLTADGLPADRALLRPSWWEITDGPTWLSTSEPLPGATQLPGLRWPRPLLHPELGDAMVDEMARLARLGQDLDLPVIVNELARRRLPTPLPRVSHLAPATRVWMLTDTSLGMHPFVTDQQDLIEAAERAVGADRVDVLVFAGDPNRLTGDRTHPQGRALEPPGTDTAVIVTSDLGLGGPINPARTPPSRTAAPRTTSARQWELHPKQSPAAARAWRQFADQMTALGVPVVLLVPLPAERWRHLPAIQGLTVCAWDRSVTMAELHALLQTNRTSRGATGENNG